MLDIRALSLGFGIASAVVTLIALVFFGGAVGISDMLQTTTSGLTSFWVGLLAVVASFIQGLISGAIVGWVYNRLEAGEWTEVDETRGAGREAGAAA